jgi:ABC-type multidrug transport system ATPase subunit
LFILQKLALGHRPELLILDEPVASLDPMARRWFLESILEMAADEKRTRCCFQRISRPTSNELHLMSR